MTTALLPVLRVCTSEQPVCPTCGQPLPQRKPEITEVNTETIADLYDVWPTDKHGRRIGPKVLVVELKGQR